jgi:hypothetical protein
MKDDLTKYREARMKRDPEFAKRYEKGYKKFKIEILMKAGNHPHAASRISVKNGNIKSFV